MRQRANEDKNKRSRAKSLSPKKSAPMSMSNSEYSLLDTSIDSSIDSSKQKSSSISNLLQKIPFSKKIITPFSNSSSKHRKNSNNRSNFLTSPVFVVVSAMASVWKWGPKSEVWQVLTEDQEIYHFRKGESHIFRFYTTSVFNCFSSMKFFTWSSFFHIFSKSCACFKHTSPE